MYNNVYTLYVYAITGSVQRCRYKSIIFIKQIDNQKKFQTQKNLNVREFIVQKKSSLTRAYESIGQTLCVCVDA